jgi:hypothetical protein
MRRFIKTFTVKRHTQFTVVQDGQLKAFLILRWDAGKTGPEQVGEPFAYENFRRSVEGARADAIGAARKLAAEAGQSLSLGAEPALSAEEAEALDERAAASGQALSPAEQEALQRR